MNFVTFDVSLCHWQNGSDVFPLAYCAVEKDFSVKRPEQSMSRGGGLQGWRVVTVTNSQLSSKCMWKVNMNLFTKQKQTQQT